MQMLIWESGLVVIVVVVFRVMDKRMEWWPTVRIDWMPSVRRKKDP